MSGKDPLRVPGFFGPGEEDMIVMSVSAGPDIEVKTVKGDVVVKRRKTDRSVRLYIEAWHSATVTVNGVVV